MRPKTQDFKLFITGLVIGIFLTPFIGFASYKTAGRVHIFEKLEKLKRFMPFPTLILQKNIVENFTEPVTAAGLKQFGKENQLTFELYRGGAFVIDGKSGYALQKSDSYRDSAFIRPTHSLPRTYKISTVAGDIDYGLEKIDGLANDLEYSEGPRNENGCYLLAITDASPVGHHTNTWWHQHRKVVIDVDNNIWGHGMPNPIFMVYFDKSNKLTSFDGDTNRWQNEWKAGLHYDPKAWYRVEIEKTRDKFILSVLDDRVKTLRTASVPLKDIWHEDEHHEDYFVIGDPHENYYQGSMKIKSITFTNK